MSAYRLDSDPHAEGPFRTLRGHRWVSGGRGVVTHSDGALEGKFTIYCSLNTDAARLARRGQREAAIRLAEAAAHIESSEEFEELVRILSTTPAATIQAVRAGSSYSEFQSTWASKTGYRVWHLLVVIAGRASAARATTPEIHAMEDTIAGIVTGAVDDGVMLHTASEHGQYWLPSRLLPSWWAHTVGRPVVVVNEFLPSGMHSAVKPGIESEPFDPFVTPEHGYVIEGQAPARRVRPLVPMREVR